MKNKKIINILIIVLISNWIYAQDTIVDLSIDSFITIRLNDIKKSDIKEFAIRDSLNSIHYYKFTNINGECNYSKFRPNGIIEIKGEYQGSNKIEFYSIWTPNPKTAYLEEEEYYRIVPIKINKWQYFDSCGKLIKVEFYKNGKVIYVE